MAEYRYYLIPDAMTRAFPEKFEKQTPTEFFDNIADLEKRYHQLREMPYNNERTWNERARFPYARLVVGVDRQNPDGAVAIIQVRNGVNYLCDDYRGPYADGNDAQIPKMAKKLVEVIGVDRVRPHTYTQRDGYTWVQVEKDWAVAENINAMRAAAGLPALTVDGGLSSIANSRCDSFASGGSFDHSGAVCGEIIAAGPFASASSVCAAWKSSPDHYASIVSPNYSSMGIGCWFCSTEAGQYTYWAVTFQ